MVSKIHLIAAIGSTRRELGKDNGLLWQIPEDLKQFRALTMGHPVIMGRKTWESLPEKFRPLKGRTNFVVSRRISSRDAVGAVICPPLEFALELAGKAEGGSDIFIIGGARMYEEALPFADELNLTLIDDEKEADVFFPEYEADFSPIHSSEEFETEDGISYRFVTFKRT